MNGDTEGSGVKLEDLLLQPRQKKGKKQVNKQPDTKETQEPEKTKEPANSSPGQTSALVVSSPLEQATYAVIADNSEIMRRFGFRMPEPMQRVLRHIVFAVNSRDYEVDGTSYTSRSLTSLATLDDGEVVEIEPALVWAVKLSPGIVYPGILLVSERFNKSSRRKIMDFWPLGIGARQVLEHYNKLAGPDPIAQPVFPLPEDDVEFRKIGSTPTIDLYVRKVRTMKRKQGDGENARVTEWHRVGYRGSKPIDLVEGSEIPPAGVESRFTVEEKRRALRVRYVGPAVKTEGLRLANPMAMAEMVLPKPDPFLLLGIPKEQVAISELKAIFSTIAEGRVDEDHPTMQVIAELGYEVPATVGTRRKLLRDLIPAAMETATMELRRYADELYKACLNENPLTILGVASEGEIDARAAALREGEVKNDPVLAHMNTSFTQKGLPVFDPFNPTHKALRLRLINNAVASVKRKQRAEAEVKAKAQAEEQALREASAKVSEENAHVKNEAATEATEPKKLKKPARAKKTKSTATK